MSRHLLHIGYPKAGSTFLQHWFEKHPQLAYRKGGLAGFRDVYAIVREAASGGDEPLYRVTSTEGLATPAQDAGLSVIDFQRRRETDIHAAQLRACALLRELFPGAVVLIVTRGFRSMILSTYSQFVRSGGHLSLDELLALTSGEGFARVAAWDYDALITVYRATFGEENVIVMPYELLRDDTPAFTRILSERLGIDSLPGNAERVNESLSASEMYWYPRFTRLVMALRSRRVYGLFVTKVTFLNRLRRGIRVLEKLRPARKVTDAMIADEVIEPLRGHAETLRGNPLYARYSREYLLD